MTFSFVIPIHNNWTLCHSLLFNIYKTCFSVDEVVVVDDGSTDEDVFKGLRWWKETKMLPIRVVETEENVGFLRASIIGLRSARGNIVCLISNDVVLHRDIIIPIKGILEEFPKSLIGGRLLDFDTGWNNFGGHIFWYLEGWLLCTTRECWKDLGYFDDRFAPHDFEDVDLSTSAKRLGYNLLPLDRGMSSHIGAQSMPYSPEREKLTQKNRKKFADKWLKNVVSP